MNVEALIAAAIAAPKTHRVVTTYECGKTRVLETASEKQASNHAIGERRLIGRSLASRETGATVRVVSVVVEAI